MSSIAQTQPRTGRRNFTLRAYLAGTAATAAMIGAVVLAFASLGAYVAFNGLPIGGSDANTDTASVAVERAAAHESASRPQGAQNLGAANVRSAQGAPAGSATSRGGGPATSDATATSADTGTGPVSTSPEPTVSATGSDQTTTATSTQGGPSNNPPSTTIPTPHVTTPDSVGGTVGTVEQTLHDAGINVPLNGAGSAVDDTTGSLLGGN